VQKTREQTKECEEEENKKGGERKSTHQRL
jgi:hypothetical protein